jgi:hypothetical protein
MIMISFFSIYEISFPVLCVFISHYNRIILICEYSMIYSLASSLEEGRFAVTPPVRGGLTDNGKKGMIFLEYGPGETAGR